MSEDKDYLSQALLAARITEATNLGDRLRDSMKTIDTVNNLGLTIVAAGVSYGVTQHQPVVLVLMPIVIFIVVVHAVQTFTELLMMGGQRKCLEEVIKDRFNAYALFSESVIAPLRVNSLDLVLKQGLYGLVLCGLSVLGSWEAIDHLSNAWLTAYFVVLTYGIATLGVSVVKMQSAYEVAYEAACAKLKIEKPSSRSS